MDALFKRLNAIAAASKQSAAKDRLKQAVESGWRAEFPAHYGYFRATEGNDGDAVDVFVGENRDATTAYIVDQTDPGSSTFDEHKVLMGFDTEQAARDAYLSAFEGDLGQRVLGTITPVSTSDPRQWIEEGDQSSPYSEAVSNAEAIRSDQGSSGQEGAADAEGEGAGSSDLQQSAQGRAEAGDEQAQGEGSAEGTVTPQTQTDAFQRWFGDSKVTDAQGHPEIVYHGTARDDFSQFDTFGSNYGLMGQGAYFTENAGVASEYTSKGARGLEQRGQESAPTVYPVYLSLQSPIDMDAPADVDAWQRAFDEYLDPSVLPDNPTNEQVYREVEDSVRDEGVPSYEGAEIMQGGLQEMGHDGLTHMGGGRVDSDGPRHRVLVAFEPEQIKSATGNRGT